MTMYEIEILQDTRNYIRWNIDQYVPKGIRNYSIEGHGKGTVHLIPEGKTYRERISISKKAMKVIRAIKGEDEKSVEDKKRSCQPLYTIYTHNHSNQTSTDSSPLSDIAEKELKRRASKCFTNAGDAMIALQELKRRMGL